MSNSSYSSRSFISASTPILRSSSSQGTSGNRNSEDTGRKSHISIPNIENSNFENRKNHSIVTRLFGTENKEVFVTHAWVSFQFWFCAATRNNKLIMLSMLFLSIFGIIFLSWNLFSNVNAISIPEEASVPTIHVPDALQRKDPETNLLQLSLNLNSFQSTSRTLPSDYKKGDASNVLSSLQFAIIIDAGSSGSRVYVYSWNTTNSVAGNREPSLPRIFKGDASDSSFQFKEQPGISSFENNIQGVSGHLRPLLDFAAKIIPSVRHHSTPIFLYATAGMRLLNSNTQSLIMKQACEFTQSSYKFDTSGGCHQHFRIISGDLEGILGWLSVNYLKGSLKSTSMNKELPDTFGFLDMGGASFQIAFSPTTSMAKKHADDLKSLKLRFSDKSERNFSLFVNSFLGFGANEAYHRYQKYLLESANSEEAKTSKPASSTNASIEISDPCLPVGYSSSISLPADAASPKKDLVLKGAGSFDGCRSALLPLLNKTLTCPDTPCLFNGVHAPILDFANHRFIGTSEFWYSTWSVFDDGGVYDYKKILDDARGFCNLTWSTMKEKMLYHEVPHVDEEARLRAHCFKSAWVMSVLHEGLGMRTKEQSQSSSDQRPLFESMNEFKGFELSWTLGVALLLASNFFSTQSTQQMNYGIIHPQSPSLLYVFYLAVSLLVFLIAIMWFFSLNSSWKWKRRSSLSYSSIIDVSSKFDEGDTDGPSSRLGIRIV